MTLLTLIRDACDRIGVARPTVVITATDATARRLLALANEEGRQLSRQNWPILRKEQTFLSTATEIQTNAIPSNWGRFVDRTFWNRTAQRMLVGPKSPQAWQDLKAHIGSGTTDSFTYRGDDILITPTATAGQTMAFEYYSRHWCSSADGVTTRGAWAADGDIGILDEDLMGLGVVWRFQKNSGLAWQESYAIYTAELRAMLGQSQPAGIIDMTSRRTGWPYQPGVYVPERDIPG